MDNAFLSADDLQKLKKFNDNVQSANRLYNKLQAHVNEYVVISNGEIKGYFKSLAEARKEFGELEGVFIDLITPENISWIL
jgi:hypothetical protein